MIKLRPIRSLPLRILIEILHSIQITFGMGSITHIETDEPVAALTFDDGPDEYWTPKILDVLIAPLWKTHKRNLDKKAKLKEGCRL